MPKTSMMDFEIKNDIKKWFPGQATFRLLVHVAHSPEDPNYEHEEFAGFERLSKETKGVGINFLKENGLFQETRKYRLTEGAEKYLGSPLETLYACCSSCLREKLLGTGYGLHSYCYTHGGGNDHKIQTTGCIDFNPIK